MEKATHMGSLAIWYKVLTPGVGPPAATAPISVLRCQFTNTTPAFPDQYYRDLFLNRGTGGLPDYFDEMAYGRYNMQVEIKGWYTIPMSLEQAKATFHNRDDWFNGCVNAAKNGDGYVPPAGNVVIVMTAPSVDLWGGLGRVFVSDDPKHGSLVHELLHGFGLNHSFGLFGSGPLFCFRILGSAR